MAIDDVEFRHKQAIHLIKAARQSEEAAGRLHGKLHTGRLLVMELIKDGELKVGLARRLQKWLEESD